MNKKSNKGVQGDWILVEPEKVRSMLASDQLVQKGTVISSGPLALAKTGDTVILKDWQIERIVIGEDVTYYAPSSAVLHIL